MSEPMHETRLTLLRSWAANELALAGKGRVPSDVRDVADLVAEVDRLRAQLALVDGVARFEQGRADAAELHAASLAWYEPQPSSGVRVGGVTVPSGTVLVAGVGTTPDGRRIAFGDDADELQPLLDQGMAVEAARARLKAHREAGVAGSGDVELEAVPKRRLRSCVDQWPDAETGAYNPACCRFPKSCSATIYSDGIDEADLEPLRGSGGPIV